MQTTRWKSVSSGVCEYVNSLAPRYTYTFCEILVKVMACCLTTPSQYLNQYWLINGEVMLCSLMGNITGDHGNVQDIWSLPVEYVAKLYILNFGNIFQGGMIYNKLHLYFEVFGYWIHLVQSTIFTSLRGVSYNHRLIAKTIVLRCA